jgi:ATP-binding cassette subfamily B multidrug efflux pump
MLKLAKHLRPYTGLIVAAIILLFIQAAADLSLPYYMSNIVNVGIQQGGIENAVPEAIRRSQMDKLLILINEEDKTEVLSNYIMVDEFNTDYDKYLQQYPALINEPIYVLKDIDSSKIIELNPIIGKAFIAVAGLERIKDEVKDRQINFNGIDMSADMDIFTILDELPEQQRNQIIMQFSENIAALGDSMIVQSSVDSVKAEYLAIGMDTNKIQNRYIILTGLTMLLISIVSAVSIVGVGFLASKTSAGLSRDLRNNVFTKVESFSNKELDKFSTASLITRTTNDITQIQMLVVMLVRMIFYAPIMGVGGIIKAVEKSSSMSWIIAVAVIALLGLIAAVFVVSLPKFKVIQKLVDRLNLVTRENLSGMMVIRAFNTQKFEEQRFDKANRDLTDTNLFVNRVMVVMYPTMMLIMNGVTLLIVWVGAHQIEQSSMQVGDMMAFMQYVMQIIFAFLMMSFMFIMVPRASVAAHRIAEVLETQPGIVDPNVAKDFDKNLKGVVEFKNVCFRYNGAEENMLKNISFKAQPGQITAIIGPTGSGKTTLVNLIPRFYDVTEGQVYVEGVDVREVLQHDLRDKIGYVPQESLLFSGTIESNLKYANQDASVEDMMKVSEIAQAMEFIKEKDDGFKSEISQGGSNVSGGQKQRLSIARALIKNPEIYIFDDSFSALDFKTEAELKKALEHDARDKTIIIIAQRIATIMKAEQIIVLDEGRIVGIGTHDELMENCNTYQEIALSQLSKEELA